MTSKITWKLSETGACLTAGSGLLFFAKKTPQGISFNTIMEMIKNDPENDAYQVIKQRRLTLGKAIEMKKIDKLGEMINLSTTVSLNTIRHDRNFEELPYDGGELISGRIFESKPFEVDEI